MHSKRIPASIPRFAFLLKLGLGPRIPILWKLGLFDKNVFAERVMSFTARRIFKKKDFQERNLR